MVLHQKQSAFLRGTDNGLHLNVPIDQRPSIDAFNSAKAAIEALGPEARRHIPPSALVQFGNWLDWPDWFKTGTALPLEPGLPARISIAEDLTMLANIVDHGQASYLLSRFVSELRMPGTRLVAPALYNAPNLREALILTKRASETSTPYIKLIFEESDPDFSVTIQSVVKSGNLFDFIALSYMCMMHRFISFVLPSAVDRLTFELALEKGSKLSTFLKKVNGTKKFGCKNFAVRGASDWLFVHNPHADPAFWNFAIERVGLIERNREQYELVERIRLAIRAAIEKESRVPRLKQIAAAENVSERTLVRNLSSKGISFQKILEEERRMKASEMIGNTSVSLAEIASSLGFSDLSSFGRSFKQWYGMTPGQARYWRENPDEGFIGPNSGADGTTL